MDGIVLDQAVVGNTVYVVGEFKNARPAGAAAGENEQARQVIEEAIERATEGSAPPPPGAGAAARRRARRGCGRPRRSTAVRIRSLS